MTVLFDLENIRVQRYRDIKYICIGKFGLSAWHEAKKVWAMSVLEFEAIKQWNDNIRVYTVESGQDAADKKLIDLVKKSGDDCFVLVSSDRKLAALVAFYTNGSVYQIFRKNKDFDIKMVK